MGTKIFDLVTLTLKFCLLLKNLTLASASLLEKDEFHMYIPCDKTFSWVHVPTFLT